MFITEITHCENSSAMYLLLGTAVSSAFWNGCCGGCWNAGKVVGLLLKNVLLAVWVGGVASEKRSSVNNCCCWFVVFADGKVGYCPFDDDDGGGWCWEKKSVSPKPFPLDVVVGALEKSLFYTDEHNIIEIFCWRFEPYWIVQVL